MLNGVTLQKRPYLCSCKSAELSSAVSGLCPVKDQELAQFLTPYQGSTTSVVLRSTNADNVVGYLAAAENIEKIFIDSHVVKAFTDDSLTTYLAFKRDSCYEIYQSRSESEYMW